MSNEAKRLKKLYTFPLDENLRQALEAIREDSGVPVAYQIRRGIVMWLEAQGRPVAGTTGKRSTAKKTTTRKR